jgi:hypothetical protein
MPSPLAEALADQLLERLPPGRAYDRAALDEAAAQEPPLPRTVHHFLERMMARRVEIEREHLRVLRQPWLDHEHDDVQRAEERLLEAVRRHVRIPGAAWERVLRHASGYVAAYLVRPAPALTDFVFGSGAPEDADPEGAPDALPDALPAAVVLRRLGYFAAYPYLHEAARAYVARRDVPAFERERLAALLQRVDQKMCDSHAAADWLRLLQPLFALAQTAYPNHDGLPVEVLEEFFEAKKARQPLQRLRQARREQEGLTALSPAALAEVIAPSPPPAEPPADLPKKTASATATPEASAADASERAPEPDRINDAPQQARHEPAPSPHEEIGPAFDPPQTDKAQPDAPRAGEPRADAQPNEERADTPGVSPQTPTGEPSAEGPAASEGENVPPGEQPDPEEQARPLWKRFLGVSPEGDGEESAPPSSSGSPSSDAPAGSEALPDAPPSDAEPDDADPRPRWQQFSAVSPDDNPPASAPTSSGDTPPPARDDRPADAPPLRPLEEQVLGHAADNRALFVRELFGGSRDDYAAVLRRLRDLDEWRTATQIIARDVFRAHQVNIYSDPARSFTNAVEARFRRNTNSQ